MHVSSFMYILIIVISCDMDSPGEERFDGFLEIKWPVTSNKWRLKPEQNKQGYKGYLIIICVLSY